MHADVRPVAGPPPSLGGGFGAWLVQLVLLIAVPLGLLLFASIAALLIVRIGADLRIGLDPLMAEARRPRLPLAEMAGRAVAADLLRQAFLIALVIGTARWSEGAAWPRRLALTGPDTPRISMGRLWLLLTVWPIVHIAWVTAMAHLLHVSFGRGTHLSPFLNPYAVAGWFAYIVLLAPLAEELLMRGEAFARASRFLRPAGAIAATALLFACAHASAGGLAQPLSLLPLALTLGWLRWRTGRLWPGIVLHAWSNLALVAYLLWPGIR